jgi:ABC-type uncharacterized transport system permease subunit
MASTFFYTISYILFIKVIYSNVDSFAGYGVNETLLLMLVGQISFYSAWFFYHQNLNQIGPMVNKGDLDLLLTKPVPATFYITFKKISIISILRDGVIPILALIFVINWDELDISVMSAGFGILIWAVGMYVNYIVNFLVQLPVFWLGKGGAQIEILYEISNHVRGEIPFEGLTAQLKFLFGIIIPLAIDVGIATSVILGKSDGVLMLGVALAVAAMFTLIKDFFWQMALRAYSSASS